MYIFAYILNFAQALLYGACNSKAILRDEKGIFNDIFCHDEALNKFKTNK